MDNAHKVDKASGLIKLVNFAQTPASQVQAVLDPAHEHMTNKITVV